MRIEVTMKDPDTLYDSINEAVDDLKIDGISETELEAVKEKRKEEIRELCGKWFEYGEYVTLIIDTEKETCIVAQNTN